MRRSFLCIKKVIAVAVASVLMLCSLSVSVSAELQHRTIKVGFFAFDGYHMIDDDGNRSGYGYDLLQHMAGYTNWQFEYVGYEKSWSEMQDMLENGEIDVLTSAQKTEERMERFDFSNESIGVSSAILTVKSGNNTYLLKDYVNWSGMRIGLLKGNSRNEDLAEFAEEKGFTYIPVYFNSTNELTAALQDSEIIDAAVTSNLRAVSNETILAKFAPSPFYIMVRKGNTELLAEINETLELLYANHPELQTELMEEYYTPKSGDEIAFTAEERQFITEMQDTSFKAFMNPDRMPLSYYENGKTTGIIGEIASEIIKRSGLNIEMIEPASREEYLALLDSENADICVDFAHDFSIAEKYDYHLTSSYVNAGISKLYLKNNTSKKRAGLINGSYIVSGLEDKIKSEYEDIQYYNSTDGLLKAIENGECDVGFMYTRVCERLTLDDARNRLTSGLEYDSNVSFCIAVKSGSDPRLFSILDKAAASLSDDQVNDIVRKYTAYEASPNTLIKFIYDNPFVTVALVAALFMMLILAAYIVLMIRRRKQEKVRLEEEKTQNRLLSEALAAAKSADESKRSFLSHMSHEIRTPLNAVIGFMELSEGADLQQQNIYRENALVAAKQLLSIINDVLDMSAISSGKMKIENVSFNFSKLIKEMTDIYAVQCKAKGIEMQTAIELPASDWLIGDEMRLRQILMNLLGNAVKFTEKGFVRLTVKQRKLSENRVFIRFAVEDSGIGMSENMLSRIGEPFEQDNAETARKHGGSGLGLSIVKMLVSMMSGAFKAESTEGVGSTLTVDLPFTIDEHAEDKNPQEENNDIRPQKNNLLGRRILIAEDNAVNRTVAAEMIKRMGAVSETAADGKEALDMFSASAKGYYDAILMDIQMPNMDGYEATKAIRTSGHPDAGSIAIIALSANAFKEDVAKSISHGMNDHVAKPIDAQRLADALQRAIYHEDQEKYNLRD